MLGILVFFLVGLVMLVLEGCFTFPFVVELLLLLALGMSFWWGWNLSFYSWHSFSFLGWDSMSLNLILLTVWCSLMMFLASFHFLKKYNSCSSLVSTVVVLSLVLVCSFSVKDLLSFYILFELSLVPTFILIMKWGYQPERIQASLYMVMYTVCASLPLLFSILIFKKSGMGLSMLGVWSGNEDPNLWVWSLFLLLSFFVKTPLYFSHLWLPKAHVEAPVAGSMVLAGVLLKLGSYGLIRVISVWFYFIFKFSEFFVCVSLVGGVLTGMICVVQSDLKSLIAYSSIGHMGILTAGILSMNFWGVVGGVAMMVAHGLCSSGMFYLANTYYLNSNSRSVLLNKGVLFSFPFMVMFSFLIFSCNMSAPPSINLAGELLLCMSVLYFSSVSAVSVVLMVFLSGVYSMYLYILSCHGVFIKSFSSWKEAKDYDLLNLILHFVPIWLIVLNLKLYI